AGADTIYGGIYGCELCSTDANVSMNVYVNGYFLDREYTDDEMGNATAIYQSQTIVELGSIYSEDAQHGWDDGEAASTSSQVNVPGVPSIRFNGVDATDPYNARLYFGTTPNGFQSLYSSTIAIGGQFAISYDTENPTFTMDQSQFPSGNPSVS